MIFAGDFCGGISGFDMKTKKLLYYTNVALPIRTLNAIPNNDIVLVGTMDGTIYEWYYLNCPDAKPIIHVEGTATIIKIY